MIACTKAPTSAYGPYAAAFAWIGEHGCQPGNPASPQSPEPLIHGEQTASFGDRRQKGSSSRAARTLGPVPLLDQSSSGIDTRAGRCVNGVLRVG